VDLADFRRAPVQPGIYVIGKARDPAAPVVPNDDYDSYVANWPDNMDGLYVGISEGLTAGLRGRLRCHFRGKGNKDVARRLALGQRLWFITSTGLESANYEALFLCLKSSNFLTSNVRGENSRFPRRLIRKVEADMRSRGIEPPDLSQFDPEDFG